MYHKWTYPCQSLNWMRASWETRGPSLLAAGMGGGRDGASVPCSSSISLSRPVVPWCLTNYFCKLTLWSFCNAMRVQTSFNKSTYAQSCGIDYLLSANKKIMYYLKNIISGAFTYPDTCTEYSWWILTGDDEYY